MLEMHKLSRYEHAPVIRFGANFDAAKDVSALAQWLQDFTADKGRPPRLLSFTFHAADNDADSICYFMKLCACDPVVRSFLIQARVELLHAGSMAEYIRDEVHERIATQRF
jgi:hypothetical protein